MEFLLAVLGTVMVIEGAPWFLSPSGVRRMLRQVEEASDGTLRFGGLTLMLAGLLVVHFAVR